MAAGEVVINVKAKVDEAKSKLESVKQSAEGIGETLNKNGGIGEKALSALGTAAKAVGKAAVAGAATAGTAVLGIGTAALSAYADYEQLVGGVDKLFGSASGKLQQYAANAYKTAGMSANQYMEQATSFSASLISSLAGDTEKAADYANLAMTTMADNVNVFGSNMTDVQNAFQGFAKQNYTMLDNLKLGYGGTQEEMKRLIADANELPGVMKDGNDLTIDSYADVIEAIARVQQAQGIMGTTAAEAAGTISGSIAMAKAAWENWLTGLGDENADMSQLTQNLLDSLEAVAANVAPRAAEIGQAILDNLPSALSGAAEVLTPILSEAVATAWNAAVGALSSMGIELPEIDSEDVLAALDAVSSAVQTFSETVGPVVSGVIQALADGFQAIADNIEIVIPIVSGLVAAFLAIAGLQAVVDVIKAIWIAIGFIASPVGIAVAAIAVIVAAITAFATNACGCRDTVVGAFETVKSFIGGLPAAIGGFFSDLVSRAVSWASSMAEKASSAGSKFVSNVVSYITNLPARIAAHLNAAVSRAAMFVSAFASKAKAAARQFTSNIVSGLSGIAGKVGSVGSNIVHGIWNGISGAAGWLYNKVAGFASNIVGSIKGALGIASPSKVMRDKVGRFIAEGIGVGFERFDPFDAIIGTVQGGLDSLSGLIDGAVLDAGASVSVGLVPEPAPVGAAGGGTVYNVTVDGRMLDVDGRIKDGFSAFISAVDLSRR